MDSRKLLRTIAATLIALLVVVLTTAAQGPDPSKVEISAVRITDSFYALEGAGGRMGVLTGPDGIFIVDSSFAPVTEKVVAAIRKISNAPLRFLVNTHVHGDHSGGNENFAKLGVTLLSRPLLRARLIKPSPPPGGGAAPAPAPAAALPTVTYDARTIVHLNGEAIELLPLVAAHTDGDTGVRFPRADVVMTGDVYRSAGYPAVDLAAGGTIKGMIESLNTLIELSGPATKVLPGHGPIVDRAALVAHRDMAVVVRDRVAKMVQGGQTEAQVVGSKPTKDFDDKYGNAIPNGDRFVSALYTELKAAGSQ
jgi:glyoxylase-like metal-dependent hydrolase (beta-lactamase superfamily II)